MIVVVEEGSPEDSLLSLACTPKLLTGERLEILDVNRFQMTGYSIFGSPVIRNKC